MDEKLPQKPLISVIIPLYNHKNTIAACLQSIQAQTYPHIEIIVVDDGSTDGGSEIAKAFENVMVLQQRNSGAPVARNAGSAKSHGDFLLFCDADILMQPQMLETMYETLTEHPEHAFAYSAFTFGYKLFHGIPFDRERLFVSNYISTMSLIRREDFPGFDPALKRFQDWDLWLTVVKNGGTGICCSLYKPLFKTLIDGKSRIGTSWLPSILYKMPLIASFIAPKRIRKYREAREAICAKHPEVQV